MKYHDHKLQTNPWHRKKEPNNNHKTSAGQKQSYQHSLPHQYGWQTRMDIKQCITKHRIITESHNDSNGQQQITNSTNIALEPTTA